MRLLGTLLCAFLVIGCTRGKKSEQDTEQLQWQRLKMVQFYWEDERTNRLAGFSAVLRHMDEPVYWNAETNVLTGHFYRFLWLRTFDRPIVVTINSVGNGRWEVKSKLFTGQSGFTLGQIDREQSVTNASPELASLIADLDRWLPAVPEYDGDQGADGAVWMIDGVNKGQYYIVHRFSPECGWVRQIGLRFLEAAKIQEKKIY